MRIGLRRLDLQLNGTLTGVGSGHQLRAKMRRRAVLLYVVGNSRDSSVHLPDLPPGKADSLRR